MSGRSGFPAIICSVEVQTTLIHGRAGVGTVLMARPVAVIGSTPLPAPAPRSIHIRQLGYQACAQI